MHTVSIAATTPGSLHKKSGDIVAHNIQCNSGTYSAKREHRLHQKSRRSHTTQVGHRRHSASLLADDSSDSSTSILHPIWTASSATKRKTNKPRNSRKRSKRARHLSVKPYVKVDGPKIKKTITRTLGRNITKGIKRLEYANHPTLHRFVFTSTTGGIMASQLDKESEKTEFSGSLVSMVP
jgi:hypothetical protein